MIRARVFLHTRSSLLLDRLQLSVRHSALGAWVTHLDCSQWLLDSGWGVAAPDQLQRLRWLAHRAGIVTPEQEGVRDSVETIDDAEEKMIKPTLTQTYLPIRDYAIVNVTEVISPTEFYVQIVSHQRSYASLQQELDRLGDSMDQQAGDYSPRLGDIVMAGERTGEVTDHHRAEVTRVTADTVTVFLCDWGRTRQLARSSVSPCPPDLVTRLPAQAVRCALAGITVEEEKATEAGDLLYDLVTNRDEEDEQFLDLVCVAESVLDGVYTVRLYNTLSNDRDYDLGSILVNFGLARKLAGFIDKNANDMERLSENITENSWIFEKGLILKEINEKISAETEAAEENVLINSIRNSNMIRGGESGEVPPLLTARNPSEASHTNPNIIR